MTSLMKEKYRILCIGDSLTAGFPYFDPISNTGDSRSTFMFWLERKLQESFSTKSFKFINKGICGQTTQEIIDRLKTYLNFPNQMYNLIILWGGTNDIVVGRPSSEIFSTLKKGSEFAKSLSIEVFIMTLPPTIFESINSSIRHVNDLLRKNDDNFILIDVYPLLERNGKLNSIYDCGDGIHLNSRAYKIIADEIYVFIERLLVGNI